LWVAPTWPASIGWLSSWTVPGAWRAWRKWWIAGSIRPCLCFALSREQQQRSGFHYSCYQLEYSRNLLFKSGRQLDAVYQGLIDRTRRLLDVPRLKTIFGRKQRPSKTQARDGRLEKIIDRSVYDLTVFKLHFGKLDP
jgi:hypothetical protein